MTSAKEKGIPFDVMRWLSEYIEGIDKIIPDNELSEDTKEKLRSFYSKFIEQIKRYYYD